MFKAVQDYLDRAAKAKAQEEMRLGFASAALRILMDGEDPVNFQRNPEHTYYLRLGEDAAVLRIRELLQREKELASLKPAIVRLVEVLNHGG